MPKSDFLCFYPMVESYQHFEGWPDERFSETKIAASLEHGIEYKMLIRDMYVVKYMEWYRKVDDTLREKFHVVEDMTRLVILKTLMQIGAEDDAEMLIENLVVQYIEETVRKTARYQLLALLKELYRFTDGMDYYSFSRKLFIQIIRHNIYKTNKILTDDYFIPEDELHDYFLNLELEDVLKKQNADSRDVENGCITVLSTGVFWVPDYNFGLIKADV